METMFENSSLVIVLLVASLLVNLVTLVLVIVLFRKNRVGAAAGTGTGAGRKEDSGADQAAAAVSGIVFCRGCGNQYDSINAACPSCKTVR
ncbi:MAG: hypothetical protein ABGX20_14970 [Bacillus sp. (in: firmicutes)]